MIRFLSNGYRNKAQRDVSFRRKKAGEMPDESISPAFVKRRVYETAAKAASRAAIRSFTFSVPMDRRMVLGRMP